MNHQRERLVSTRQPRIHEGVKPIPESHLTATGTFEPNGKDGGFLRRAEINYLVRPDDPFLSSAVRQRFRLRGGETITATTKPRANRPGGRGAEVVDVATINGLSAEDYFAVKPFDELTAIDPHRQMRFETPGGPVSMRVVDLMTPIGFGQRGLIVASPRTGKTILLQQIAQGAAANHPDLHVLMLLIDERPEEVTEMRRTVPAEVAASSSDMDLASHIRLARLVIQKAQRLVECGRDVLVLLDSLTRLGRSFNSATRGAGRTLSGGLDIRALTEPKAMFGAARKAEGGGSLTIMASALINTGSRMDEVIFNEFKGTGNMEIMLSRELANRRVWPAIELDSSGTRKEERLLSPEALEVASGLRRSLAGGSPERAMTSLLESLGRFPDNATFVASARKQSWGRSTIR